MKTTTETITIPDLNQVLSNTHYDKWVALSNDYSRVLASADSISKLSKKLSQEEKDSNPIFYKVPAKDSYYIPSLA